jgi:hypothetical protein
MTDIRVTRGADVERFLSRFEVTVDEEGALTHHTVTLSSSDYERLGGRHPTPESFVRACFEFLLQREPKESILPSFDVSAIGTYFPEFERRIQGL